MIAAAYVEPGTLSAPYVTSWGRDPQALPVKELYAPLRFLRRETRRRGGQQVA